MDNKAPSTFDQLVREVTQLFKDYPPLAVLFILGIKLQDERGD